ncbi:MAG: amphi-Trp domain-containing protein [Deltaproteobacteria bacterium]|jgi:amphi-Trp domain-containing protein|nr:amphi-Trp domain-containing protein [Deltaproteobacteria bacterium]
MNKNTFTHNFVSDPDEVADFLAALIEGFRKRRITIGSEGREQVLQVSEILDISMESSQRKGRVRLCLNVNWPETSPPRRDLFSAQAGGDGGPDPARGKGTQGDP